MAALAVSPNDSAKTKLAKSAISLCMDLVDQPGPVLTLCAAGQAALQKGIEGEAFDTGAEALAKALHDGAEELILLGASFNQEQRARAELTVKGILKQQRNASDAKGEAVASGMLADMYLCCRETNKALKIAEGALALYRLAGDRQGETAVLRTILNAHVAKAAAGVNPQLELSMNAARQMEVMKQQREAALDKAIETAREAINVFRALGDRRGEAEMTLKIAEVHLFKDEPDQAMSVCRETRAIFVELNDPYGEAKALNIAINSNLTNEEDSDDALTAAKDIVKLFMGRDRKTDEEDKKAVGDALHTLAQVHLARFETQEAMETAESAMRYYMEGGEKKNGTAVVLHTIAQIHQVDDKQEDALKAARQAMEVYQDIDFKPGEASALHNVAYMELDQLFKQVADKPEVFTKDQSGKLEEAWNDAVKALRLFQEINMIDGEDMVTETINLFIEKARKIHVQQFPPTKTIFLNEPNGRTFTKINIYDTVAAEAVKDTADDDDEELGEGEE